MTSPIFSKRWAPRSPTSKANFPPPKRRRCSGRGRASRFRPVCANGSSTGLEAMEFVIVAAAGVACATAAVSDWRTRRIPNAVAAAIAVVGLVRLGLAQELLAEVYTLTTAAAAFAVGFVLFRHGAMGGGDVKMISATILVVGYQHVLGFLFLMSLCGGTLALVT